MTKVREISLLRAQWWIVFVAIPGVLVLVALGSWQVQRLVWKNGVNEYRQVQSQSEPVVLPIEVVDVENMLYRPVWFEGMFRHDQEMYLGARSYNGNVGYHVIAPFERSDGGGVLLVNRGWIPTDRKDPSRRSNGQVTGLVRVEGLLTNSNIPGWLTPENVPEENFWYWVDLPSLYRQANLTPLDYLVDAGPATNPGGYPIGGQTKTELRNEHLQYAVIWFALAMCLSGITYLMLRGARRKKAESRS